MGNKCSLCGESIQSAVALYCIACFRESTKRCPECRDPAGRLRPKYRAHRCDPDRRCPRCERKHDDPDQVVRFRCKTCNNERVVFEPVASRHPTAP
jgi:hypothetical protein